MRRLAARLAGVIHLDAVWLAAEPVDLRLGPESALARVVAVFGAAEPHHAYLFTNRRANRLKVLVHDGFGLWLAVRRLHQGRFVWAGARADGTVSISRAQFDALVLGLPWQMLAHGVEQRGVISVL
ncbi:MAG: IS66 family insertion sequence element accessory protein TnpB [Burkholderiaceae bacterium]|nr:IS66 family insertion sequence element accessory protein TnpB [Burkholderiaceae bacterium]